MFLATEDNVTTPRGCLNMFLAIWFNDPTPRTSPPDRDWETCLYRII